MMMPLDSAASRAPMTGRAVVVGTVAGNIDDAPQPVIRILVEQRHREIDRARDRGARGPADRRLQDFVGDGVRGFRTVDQPPGNDDLLVVRCRPFEIGHRDLAVRAGSSAPAEIPSRRWPARNPRAGPQVRPCPSNRRRRRRGSVRHRRTARPACRPIAADGCVLRVRRGERPRRRLRPSRPRPAPPRSRHTSASAALPSSWSDGDTQSGLRKAGTSRGVHIQVSTAALISAKRSPPLTARQRCRILRAARTAMRYSVSSNGWGHHVSDLASLCCVVLFGAVSSGAMAETPAERGDYLVNTIMACGNCHSPRDAERQDRSRRRRFPAA